MLVGAYFENWNQQAIDWHQNTAYFLSLGVKWLEILPKDPLPPFLNLRRFSGLISPNDWSVWNQGMASLPGYRQIWDIGCVNSSLCIALLCGGPATSPATLADETAHNAHLASCYGGLVRPRRGILSMSISRERKSMQMSHSVVLMPGRVVWVLTTLLCHVSFESMYRRRQKANVHTKLWSS